MWSLENIYIINRGNVHRELRGGGSKSPVDVIFVYDSHAYMTHITFSFKEQLS